MRATGGIGCESGHTQGWNSVATNRHGIVLKNLSLAAFPPSDCRPALRKDSRALTRSFRFRIPQPPAPRGRTGSGLYARQGGPTRVGPFLFVAGRICLAVIPERAKREPGIHFSSRRLDQRILLCAIAHHISRQEARRGMIKTDLVDTVYARFSAATCTPRRAWDRASRGYRPGHRPPRHRRRRATSNSRSARSSFRDVRASRRP